MVMKTLLEFLKTDVKVITFNEENVIVHPTGPAFAEVRNEFPDEKITNNEYCLFIIDKNELKEYFKSHDFNEDDYKLYKIPQKYKSFEEISDAFSRDEFSPQHCESFYVDDL